MSKSNEEMLRSLRHIIDGVATEFRVFDKTRAVELLDQLQAALPTPPESAKGEPAYTTGHCAELAKPGGCQRENRHCGFPECDRRAAPPIQPQGAVAGLKVCHAEGTLVTMYFDSDADAAAFVETVGLELELGASPPQEPVAGAWIERSVAAKICEDMRPPGGRAFTSEQDACYNALTDAAKAIRGVALGAESGTNEQNAVRVVPLAKEKKL